MGIHGIYKEIGPGQRIALSKVAVEHFEKTGRPLRIAIDISIWLFQIQSSKGGTNPALRTFYYRLLRLISLSIHPLFVFDGPNKPPFKRNKRTGPNVASIPEFLAKQLLKQFGLPFHLAPGEAEAECALLQREGIVDAVLSEDVDTLMFGSGLTFRSWTPEATKSKVPTHINLYDAKATKETSGMDREGMILVALMSGGDYVPEGIPGCGPKTACEAARAGFGWELCQVSRRDKDGLRAWKDKLAHELHTNESKHFSRKHGKLNIPDDFPNPEVLGYYTHPVISSSDKVVKLRGELKWDMDIDFKELRTFTGDAFEWTKLGGAKKFIRNLGPALLVRKLRMRAEGLAKHPTRNAEAVRGDEESFIKGIHGKRNHGSTDGVTELRITFKPHDLVPIDLDSEEPDDEINRDSSDEEGGAVPGTEAPGSPSKKRAPSNYDPTQSEKLWIFETYVKAGAPLIAREWDDRAKNARILVETRNANREAKRPEREKNQAAKGGMQKGALDRLTKVKKPSLPSSSAPPRSSQPLKATQKSTSIQQFAKVTKPGPQSAAPPKSSQSLPPGSQGHRWLGNGRLEVFHSPEPEISTSHTKTKDLLSSSLPIPQRKGDEIPSAFGLPCDIPELLPSAVTKRRRSALRRWPTDAAVPGMTDHSNRPRTPALDCEEPIPASPSSLPSPSQYLPAAKKAKGPNPMARSQPKASTPKRGMANSVQEYIRLLSSSPGRQTNLFHYFSPRRRAAEQRRLEAIEDSPVATTQLPMPEAVDTLDLTGSPATKAKRHSPRQTRTSEQDRRNTPPPTQVPEFSIAVPKLSQPSFGIPPSSLPPHTAAEIAVDKAKPSHSLPVTKKKQIYRIRDSLPGAFAIEELDMTNDVGTKNVRIIKKGKQFRKSEVSVLDLSGD